MSCNIVHNHLISSGEAVCPFCDKIIHYPTKDNTHPCCNNKNTIVVDGTDTCINCGAVSCYRYVQDCYYKKTSEEAAL